MPRNELAGQPAPRNLLIDVPRLVSAYYTTQPEPDDPTQRVAFGTSGHRGSSLKGSFNEHHILAISQSICEARAAAGIQGPLMMGMDTHALSEPARATALEVFVANGVDVWIDQELGYSPTPVISHAILKFNRTSRAGQADGVVITPSHNPPDDGGFKYNPPTGGPADSSATRAIENRANEILASGLAGVRRMPYQRALAAESTRRHDFLADYVEELSSVVDMGAIASAKLKIGADPMGGAGILVWDAIADRFGFEIDVVNRTVDPTFGFMTLDADGKIRMDCSSPYAMAGLIGLRDRYDIAFGNDPDFDRHGIVTPSGGLMNPNHFLAVSADYLFRNRAGWPQGAGLGKTLVSSSMLDRVAADNNRPLVEVPVGFKWFVSGLLDGSIGFAGEESAGASFLRKDGTVWTTDKDGIILALLAAEMTARTGKDPSELYRELEQRHGTAVYERIDAPAGAAQKEALANLSPAMVTAGQLAGEEITDRLTQAPGNDAPLGGLKVMTRNGWFAARPSGTEDVYKIYAESFLGVDHLRKIQQEARGIIDDAFASAGVAGRS
ncbi:MAG: alpha-D-glucose phosphate-specific phosphoglucomutase [Gemmatimonadetes bacterium]|nr:alpha-D-glucose phosphate-specific phosphoglucomutase [Gemmatimonadota bacterium]